MNWQLLLIFFIDEIGLAFQEHKILIRHQVMLLDPWKANFQVIRQTLQRHSHDDLKDDKCVGQMHKNPTPLEEVGRQTYGMKAIHR